MSGWLNKVRRSLGLRMILLFLAAGIVVVAIIAVTFAVAARHRFEDNVLPHLNEYQGYLLRELGDPPSIERARELSGRLPLEIVIQGPQGEWNSSERLRGLGTPRLRFPSSRPGRVGHVRGYRLFRNSAGDYTVYFATPLRAAPAHATRVLVLTILLLFGLLLLVYLGIRRLFSPLEKIRSGLALIGDGDLSYRIDVKRKDELGALADSVNDMAGRIQQMLDAKRELLLAISHELRSPLTRARINAELVDEPARRETLVKDLSEMEGLIAELLESERLSDVHAALLRTPVDINDLVREVLEEGFEGEPIDSELNGPKGPISLDAARIRLLVRNLLANAVRHNRPEAGRVKLTLEETKDSGLKLQVRDCGEGIPADRLERITEPFFRVDRSRQRGTGGYGLGLYLCRLVVEAHQGEMKVTSEEGIGTRVVVQIPVVRKGR